MPVKRLTALFCGLFLLTAAAAWSEEIGQVSTTFKFVGANDKIVIEAFDDPDISGATCYVSRARTGGVKGAIGVAEDTADASISCRQTGPITLPEKMPKEASVFSQDTSVFFKETRVTRLWDEANRTLVYLAISRKLIDGAPANSISTVPIMPWKETGGQREG